MAGRRIVLWEVDAQADFMLPGGALYIPGGEKIIPNIQRLLDAARANSTLVVSSRCAHTVNDPEFETFPPHCIRGTPGAEIIPQGMLDRFRVIENNPSARLPADVLAASQIVIEKQQLDVFSNPRTGELVERLGSDAEYVVFGVATEYCVQFATRGLLARGRKVSIVTDAMETLDAEAGRRTVSELQSIGARAVTTAEAVAEVGGKGERR
jgi:nicotinamidase/pyrazinamidase